MERHRGRLIHHSFIFSIVVAVNADLHSQRLERLEIQEHVAIYRQFRKREHAVVRRGLIGDGIVPVPDSELQFLLELGGEDLNASAMLLRKRLGIEIDHVLHVFDSDAELGAAPGNVKAPLGAETADFAEIVVPCEMVADIIVVDIVRLEVAEKSVGRDFDGVFAKTESCFDFTLHVDISGHIAEDSEFGVGRIADMATLSLRNSSADPETVPAFGCYEF